MNQSVCMAIETTRELFSRIVNFGINPELLLEKTGVDADLLQQSERRFPVKQHLQLWQVAEEYLPNEAIGVMMGATSNPSNRGIVGLVFLASADLASAVSNKVRYTKILADHIDLVYSETHDAFMIDYSIDDDYFHPYEIERVFSGFLNWVKIFLGRAVCPAYLHFQYAQPENVRKYDQYFQCPMTFGHERNQIAFSKELLSFKNAAYNDYLYGILQTRAESLLHQLHQLNQLQQEPEFLVSVRSTIAGRLCHGNFLADDLALAHHISLRTLHRKLKHEGMTYQQLLDDVRKEIAVAYLNQEGCSVKDLPYMLGYADNRAFQRAFKRWMGCSPRQYFQS